MSEIKNPDVIVLKYEDMKNRKQKRAWLAIERKKNKKNVKSALEERDE